MYDVPFRVRWLVEKEEEEEEEEKTMRKTRSSRGRGG